MPSPLPMDIRSNRKLTSLNSSHEETDSRIIQYIAYAEETEYESVVIRSSDSDVLFILLSYAASFDLTIFLDTGVGNKRRLIDVSAMASDLGEDYSNALLGLYIFTGEDANCAFKGKGKITPLKKFNRKPRYHSAFQQLGNEWNLSEDVIKHLERFTCEMYGYPKLSSINSIRSAMIRKMVGEAETINQSSKIDLSELPPCRRSLIPHIQRVNYRAAQWKRSHIHQIELPPPTDHGWTMTDDILEPLWSDGPVLPPSLIGILSTSSSAADSDSESDMDEPDFENPFSSDDESDIDI